LFNVDARIIYGNSSAAELDDLAENKMRTAGIKTPEQEKGSYEF
jgi:hypothetical protein